MKMDQISPNGGRIHEIYESRLWLGISSAGRVQRFRANMTAVSLL